MSELKPCPFCGGEAEIHRFHVSYTATIPKYEGIAIRVRCKKCFAHSPYKASKMLGNFREGEEAKAIDAWNKRAFDVEKYLELPCKIGDTVYEIYDVEHETCTGPCRSCNTDCSSYYTCWHSTYEWKIAEYTANLHYIFHNWTLFGNRVFLTYEEAKKAMEEKNKKEQEQEEEYKNRF